MTALLTTAQDIYNGGTITMATPETQDEFLDQYNNMKPRQVEYYLNNVDADLSWVDEQVREEFYMARWY